MTFRPQCFSLDTMPSPTKFDKAGNEFPVIFKLSSILQNNHAPHQKLMHMVVGHSQDCMKGKVQHIYIIN